MIITTEDGLEFPVDATIPSLLSDSSNLSRSQAAKTAIIDGPSGRIVYTHASLREAVAKLAQHLYHCGGIRPGSVVALLDTNNVHFAVYVHAVLACGATLTALNPLYSQEELAHALALAKPEIVLARDTLLSKLPHASSGAVVRPRVVVLSDNSSECGGHAAKLTGRINNERCTAALPELSPSYSAESDAFICFSSGTSGLAKGVRLSHRNIVANTFQHHQRLREDFGQDPVFALVFPYSHILGLGVFACQYLLQGHTTVIFPSFDFPGLLRSIKRDRITHLNVVPTLALRLLQDPLSLEADFSSLRCLMNAAAPLKSDLSTRLQKLVGCSLTQWYGMTEASPSVITQTLDQVHVVGSVGKLLPGLRMKVVDQRDHVLPIGATGELCIQGPNIMTGYIGGPQSMGIVQTKDGFFKTGDIGHVDKNGFVFLEDRAKDMIKVKGNQVAPAELEAILLSHASVKDAAVKGQYVDDIASEVPVGFIITDVTGDRLHSLAGELHTLVDSKVAKYKRLTGGLFVIDEIPRNASGKILRRMLPAMPAPAEVRSDRKAKL